MVLVIGRGWVEEARLEGRLEMGGRGDDLELLANTFGLDESQPNRLVLPSSEGRRLLLEKWENLAVEDADCYHGEQVAKLWLFMGFACEHCQPSQNLRVRRTTSHASSERYSCLPSSLSAHALVILSSA